MNKRKGQYLQNDSPDGSKHATHAGPAAGGLILPVTGWTQELM